MEEGAEEGINFQLILYSYSLLDSTTVAWLLRPEVCI